MPMNETHSDTVTICEMNSEKLVMVASSKLDYLPKGWFETAVNMDENKNFILADEPDEARFWIIHATPLPKDTAELFKYENRYLLNEVDPEEFLNLSPPGESLTYDDMAAYGYTWDGMFPVTYDEAKPYMKEIEVFFLFSDNTEGALSGYPNAMTEQLVKNHMLGIQKPDWYYYCQRKKDEEANGVNNM